MAAAEKVHRVFRTAPPRMPKAHRRAHARAVVATPVPARRLPDPSQRLGRSKPIGLRTWMIQTELWLPRAECMRQWSSQWSSHVLIPPQNDDPVAQKLRENHNCSALFM